MVAALNVRATLYTNKLYASHTVCIVYDPCSLVEMRILRCLLNWRKTWFQCGITDCNRLSCMTEIRAFKFDSIYLISCPPTQSNPFTCQLVNYHQQLFQALHWSHCTEEKRISFMKQNKNYIFVLQMCLTKYLRVSIAGLFYFLYEKTQLN